MVTVSPKYQVVIPKEVREALQLRAGSRVNVIAKGGIAYLVPDVDSHTARGLAKEARGGQLRDKKDRGL